MSKFGEINLDRFVLKINLIKDYRDQFEKLLNKNCKSFKIISVENLDSESKFEIIIFEFVLKKNISYHNLLDEIGENLKPKNVNLLIGENYIEE